MINILENKMQATPKCLFRPVSIRTVLSVTVNFNLLELGQQGCFGEESVKLVSLLGGVQMTIGIKGKNQSLRVCVLAALSRPQAWGGGGQCAASMDLQIRPS